jgi:conjugal transfer pilus assembly protein TraV
MSFKKMAKGLSLLGCLFLNACTGSTYSSHFDCPYGTGAGCASLSKVNKMIDRHEIDLDEDESVCSSGRCNLRKKQVYIYYGPDQMSKVISIDESTVG